MPSTTLSARNWNSAVASNGTRSDENLNSVDMETGLRRASVSRNVLRRSITANYPTSPYNTAFPNASSTEVMSPPMYDDISEIPLPKSRFKVVPRAEEGQEALPSYTCSVRRECMFERKMELHNPYDKANDRSWSKVYAVLNNTVLSIYKAKKTSLFGSKYNQESTDKPVGYTSGTLIKHYTLQHAEVGAATDYKKRHYAIRVRAETQQFLLACNSVDIFLEWLEALSSGIDLALPLEERSLPTYQTIPRRRRRRRAAEIVQQQEEIIRTHFPQLLENSDTETRNVAPVSTVSTDSLSQSNGASEALVESANVPDLEEENTSIPSIRVESDPEDEPATSSRSFTQASPSASSASLAPRRPSIGRSVSAPVTMLNVQSDRSALTASRTNESSSDNEEEAGKWHGCSRVSREANLRFARRCMAVLTADAPRQTDYVMHKGMRYKLVHEVKGMVPDSSIILPTYESHKSFGNTRLR